MQITKTKAEKEATNIWVDYDMGDQNFLGRAAVAEMLIDYTKRIGVTVELQGIADLWPANMESDIVAEAPVTILKQQATLLGKKTFNAVEGRVAQEHVGENFQYIFRIVAPALALYSYPLLTVTHGVEFYPLALQVDLHVAKELEGVLPCDRDSVDLVAETREKFVDILRYIFATPRVRVIIQSILAQSESFLGK